MKPEHQDKLDELLAAYASYLKLECHALYHSGLIDVDSFSTEEYALAKILITAGIERTKLVYRPLLSVYRQDVNNLLNA